jgi:hypothetical protein
VRRIVEDGVPPGRIDEALFSSYLYTAGLPDPDLLIRTAGEMRLSNFLLWQCHYAEYYVTPLYWPDFGPEEIERAPAGAARSVIEEFEERPEQVAALIRKALKHIPAERLVLSSDCGFGREGMSRRIAFYKMVSIVCGANIVRRELGLPETECRASDPRFALAEEM